MQKIVFGVTCLCAISFFPAMNILSSYQQNERADLLKKHFDNNKKLICNNHIVSKSKGFSFEVKDNGKLFMTDDRYFGDYIIFNDNFSFTTKNCNLYNK